MAYHGNTSFFTTFTLNRGNTSLNTSICIVLGNLRHNLRDNFLHIVLDKFLDIHHDMLSYTHNHIPSELFQLP